MNRGDAICVLVADDQPVVREGLRTMLEADPEVAVVGEAGSGPEARRLVGELQPAVVLLDIQMPGENGLQVARWVKTHHPAVSVVMLSNYDEEPLIVEALSSGASGYLLKDCSRGLLHHTVHAVVEGAVLFKEELLRRVMRAEPEVALGAAGLTDREKDILREMALGKSNRGIAGALFVSESTVKKYVQAILAKLDAGNRTEAVAKAAGAGLLSEARPVGSSASRRLSRRQESPAPGLSRPGIPERPEQGPSRSRRRSRSSKTMCRSREIARSTRP